jgi:hypothetical protein
MAWTLDEKEFLVEKLLREYAQNMREMAGRYRRTTLGGQDDTCAAILEGYAAQADKLAGQVRRGGFAAMGEE